MAPSTQHFFDVQLSTANIIPTIRRRERTQWAGLFYTLGEVRTYNMVSRANQQHHRKIHPPGPAVT